jgi:hypothetical protein
MPSTSSYDGTCVGGPGNNLPVTDKNSYTQCVDNGGAYRPLTPDGGQNRVSSLAFGEHLRDRNDKGHGNPFSDYEVGKRLLSFPICEVHRRTPRSRFLGKLDLLDRNFTDELNRVLEKDHALRSRVSQLVLDIAWVAARALSEEGATTTSSPVVSDELLERARELGAEIRSRTKDQALIGAITDALELGGELRGVVISELVATLAG